MLSAGRRLLLLLADVNYEPKSQPLSKLGDKGPGNTIEQLWRILYGEQTITGGIFDAGTYATPCIAEAGPNLQIVHEETLSIGFSQKRFET
jgi:hypothetical protein